MAEVNAPTMAQPNWTENNVEAGVVESARPNTQPRQSRGLVIALPIHRADLPPIMLMLLAISLIGWWGWAINQPNSPLAAPDPNGAAWDPLLLSLLHQKSISLTFTLTGALLILAAALAVAPLRWWAYLRFVAKTGIAAQWRQFQRRSPEDEDAEAWVAAQAAWLEELQATVDQEEAVAAAQHAQPNAAAANDAAGNPTDPAGQPATTPTEAASAPTGEAAAQAAAPGAQTAEQAAAAPAADGQQPAAAPAAGGPAANTPQDPAAAPTDPNAPKAEKAPDAAAPAQPKGAVPKGQQPSAELAALAEESKEEALDLEDLTDVQDILSSFADNDVISAELLALSASLDEIDLSILQRQTRTVAKQLDQGMTSPQFFERVAAMATEKSDLIAQK